MPNRALIAGLLLAVTLGGCGRSVAFPEPREHSRTTVTGDPPPPPADSTSRSGGTMGSGN